jgi:hypothetical protein
MNDMTRWIALAALAAMPVAAQETAPVGGSEGTISGTLDLEEASWQVVEGEGETTTGWEATEGNRRVRIAGVPVSGGTAGDAGSILIAFTAAGTPTVAEAQDALVRFQDAERNEPWVAEGPNVDLSVEAVDMRGADMVVAGSVVARMSPGGADGLLTDEAALKTFDGNFQATIRQPSE